MHRKLFFVAFIGIVALALWLTFFTLPVFNIKSIEISGNENLSKEQIESMLNTKVGNNIFAFNKTKALKNIKSNNYVEEVSIHRKLPSTITVNIKEYKLRAYVPYMGSYLYINDYGRILDTQKTFKKQLPVVEGLKFNQFTLGEVLQVDNPSAFDTVVQLSKLFEKDQLLNTIVQVDVSDENDVHFYVGKIDVEFGSFDDANKKLLTLNEVLKQLDTSYAGVLNLTGGNPTCTYIN